MGKDRLGWLYVIQFADYVQALHPSQARLIASWRIPRERVVQTLNRMWLGMFTATT